MHAASLLRTMGALEKNGSPLQDTVQHGSAACSSLIVLALLVAAFIYVQPVNYGVAPAIGVGDAANPAAASVLRPLSFAPGAAGLTLDMHVSLRIPVASARSIVRHPLAWDAIAVPLYFPLAASAAPAPAGGPSGADFEPRLCEQNFDSLICSECYGLPGDGAAAGDGEAGDEGGGAKSDAADEGGAAAAAPGGDGALIRGAAVGSGEIRLALAPAADPPASSRAKAPDFALRRATPTAAAAAAAAAVDCYVFPQVADAYAGRRYVELSILLHQENVPTELRDAIVADCGVTGGTMLWTVLVNVKYQASWFAWDLKHGPWQTVSAQIPCPENLDGG